jgi:hypothetical protein
MPFDHQIFCDLRWGAGADLWKKKWRLIISEAFRLLMLISIMLSHDHLLCSSLPTWLGNAASNLTSFYPSTAVSTKLFFEKAPLPALILSWLRLRACGMRGCLQLWYTCILRSVISNSNTPGKCCETGLKCGSVTNMLWEWMPIFHVCLHEARQPRLLSLHAYYFTYFAHVCGKLHVN